ncbi:DUF2877 domain-containing protein [Staphylococcus sp. ACRSN]|uniref:DUF2877 domain-containing protein n=1 Tax=Staphylococcus sp. ACRSN TaxID=2918214 RepID=UPI001EF3B1BD|nr:DUF2877 domain-containing protein [Staphylococcus sp. ACRSN]MCG7337975.1 DUF2877 domain-containing protein [Staphylococcus sp. ACRSN]
MIFRASAIGSIAQEILEKKETFYVHSIFKKGFNIINEKKELIFIGTDDNGTFPFGILVDKQTRDALLAKMKQQQYLKVSSNTIYIDSATQLIWKVNLLNSFKAYTSEKVNQLSTCVEAYDFSEYEHGQFNSEYLKQFMCVLERGSAKECERYYRYIIGRGQGLTPTGDDILTGMLFIHFIKPYIRKDNLLILNQLLSETLTTIVSETFLKCAQKGLFSSKIAVLQTEPTPYHIDRLIKVGSSSGKDTLYGAFVALTLRSGTYGKACSTRFRW